MGTRKLAGLIVVAAAVSCFASLGGAQVAGSAMDQQIASYLRQQFAGNKDLSQVRPTVEDRIVTLSGSVPSYRAKLNAIHDAQQVNSANGYIDKISVVGPSVPDEKLKQDLADRLTYDRIGMGQTFNALTLTVRDGVVTVGGEVRDYPDRDSAVDIIADTKGVKGLVDKVKVAPLSPMDDQIRLAAARAIYGNPALLKYANDPAHPIRIVVNKGHVTLAGVVTSPLDKTVAGNAVRSIPGVFGVNNDLVVQH